MEQFVAPDVVKQPEKVVRTLNNLAILVHPLYSQTEPNIPPKYREKAAQLFDNAISQHAPQDPSDVTLIMPLWNGSIESYLKHRRAAAESLQRNPANIHWIDLYKQLRSNAAYKSNVMLCSDIGDPPDSNPQIILDRLKKRGFELTDQTMITVGGESLDACVSHTIKELFKLPQINRIRVNKDVVIDDAEVYFERYDPLHRAKRIQLESPDDYRVEEDEHFILITKNPKVPP